MQFEIEEVHISTIKPGDTIEHCGVARTVCKNDIKHGFMGTTVFGDSYRAGTVTVKKMVITRAVTQSV